MSLPRPVSVAGVLAAVLAVLAVAATMALAAAPSATTGDASAVTPTGAKLAGSVNPSGVATTVSFDYGTSTAYGRSSPTQSAGSGAAATDVTATLTGLVPSTTYHYRVVAANADGTDAGSDRTFTTPAAPQAPSVASQAATAVTTGGATVGASVDPNGQATKVVFDYGTTTAYGASTAAQDAGAGTSAVTIKATVQGLAPNTTYHYRARATNATGATNASDRTFKTSSSTTSVVATGAAADVTAMTATLTGTVDPNGRPTTVVAQIGPTTKYGSQTGAVSAGSGSSAVSVKLAVGALQPLTSYHYRLVATSDAGTVIGKDRSFKTKRVPNTLTLTANPAKLRYGQAATLTGRLAGTGSAGVAVNLFAAPFPFTGPYTAFAPGVRTNTGGVIATQILPRKSTRYRGTTFVAGLTIASPTLRVTVVPRVSVVLTRRAGGRVRLSGTIRPKGGATVTLRRILPNGAAITIKRTKARPVLGGVFSRYAMVLKTKPGRYRIHVKPASRGLAAGDSSVVRIRR